MGESLTVDPAALIGAAGRLDAVVDGVQASALGGPAVTRLVELRADLPGSLTEAAGSELARVVSLVAGEVVAAIEGLAGGLRVAAAAYHDVDVASGRAAVGLGEHGSWVVGS